MPEKKRILIEFTEKGRPPAVTDDLPPHEAVEEFKRVAHLLEETGTEGDRWVTVAETIVVRARDVARIELMEGGPWIA